MIFAPVIRRAAYGVTPRAFDLTLERLFSDTLFAPAQARSRGHAITQDDSAYTVQIDVPGLSREQLQVGIEGGVVRVESVADAPRAFKAAYELPQDVDVAASGAKLENGVLTLTLARKAPARSAVQLMIQ
ncbi:Hsp20/alpha crystallin family protein [Ramlibacter sp. H39-3-26]|uniref:Hsp20/alpha crystallin family protein n=1 Tax=Curvibacter soli TaxID=3031331 RepID=UPI0023DC8428|nr:Hsp20/alpha crystallin family protein [Ramlibacter sp. H39-3-26]MDF1485088.1 Hsp20/alpha crystallin family protein [Ramlibacter sp. H39-3-26]